MQGINYYNGLLLLVDLYMASKEKIKGMIRETIQQHLKGITYHAFIFGSQANLSEWKKADIDVGIEAEEPIPGYLFTALKSNLAELPTLHPVDLINFCTVDDRFKKVSKQNIEWL